MIEYNLAEKQALINDFGSLAKRDVFAKVKSLIKINKPGRVIALYGLRRTGKSVIMAQLLSEMPPEDLEKTVYIDCEDGDSFTELSMLLRQRRNEGAKIAFVDEITKASGFLQRSSALNDIFTRLGFPVIISGTDSLFFRLAELNELFDRVDLVHTTYIPWPEHKRLMGTKNIDQYIEKGGILSGEFNDYPLSAISENIEHSLSVWKKGNNSLHKLAEKGELRNIIARIVEDRNHEIVLDVLERKFKSRDVGSLIDLLTKNDKILPSADLIEKTRNNIEEIFKTALQIKEENQKTIPISDQHIDDLEYWLQKLDLFIPRSFLSPICSSSVKNSNPYLCAQPGLRWYQAQTLIKSLETALSKSEVKIPENSFIFEKLKDDIKGQMLEEIIITDAIKNLDPDIFSVTTFQFFQHFNNGEIDMIIKDKRHNICHLYEIKHSDQISDWQTKHLRDHNKIGYLNRYFGKVMERAVLYRGVTGITQGNIKYINANEFLESLPAFANSLLSRLPIDKQEQLWEPDGNNIQAILEKTAANITKEIPDNEIIKTGTNSLVIKFPLSENPEFIEKLFSGHMMRDNILNFYKKHQLLAQIDSISDQNDIAVFKDELLKTLMEKTSAKAQLETLEKMETEFQRKYKVDNIRYPDGKLLLELDTLDDAIAITLSLKINDELFQRVAANKSGKIAKIPEKNSGETKRVEFPIPHLPEDQDGIISSWGQLCENKEDLQMLAQTFFKKTFPYIEPTIAFADDYNSSLDESLK